MGEVPPQVFISHAGEDNRFARELAQRLRDNGVDAWVDEWEILPGDKLIDRIFEQGIGQCDVFAIVLSQNSVRKPWVVEELDAALVRRIQEQTKIIPIRIDDCDVPVALRATAWINIDPERDYAAELHKVLAGIFDTRTRPPIGERPDIFAQAQSVGSYDLEETGILECIVKRQADKNLGYVRSTELQEAFPDLPIDIINDAIDILEADGVIEVHRALGTAPFTFSFVQLRASGWVHYAAHFLDVDPGGDVNSVLAVAASEGPLSGSDMSDILGVEPVRVNMAADYLESIGYVRCFRTMGCAPYTFTEVEATARGRRALRR